VAINGEVPHEWRLLKAIEAFDEPADMSRLHTGLKTFSLVGVDELSKLCLLEDSCDVGLADTESASHTQLPATTSM